MGWTVYMLRCGDGTLYTGCTNDLPRRLEAHRRGRGAKYTRSRPQKLALIEGGTPHGDQAAYAAETVEKRGSLI